MKLLFYYTRDRDVPVQEELDRLDRENQDEAQAVRAKFEVVKKLPYEEASAGPYIKNIRGKIDELKMRGHQARILGFRYGDDFVAAVLTIKQQDELDEQDIVRAEERREDWYERFGRSS